MGIVMKDGRVFEGTPLQMVRGMKDIAFGVESLSLSQYIDWIVGNAHRVEETELAVTGATDEERAASLVQELLRTELARKL